MHKVNDERKKYIESKLCEVFWECILRFEIWACIDDACRKYGLHPLGQETGLLATSRQRHYPQQHFFGKCGRELRQPCLACFHHQLEQVLFVGWCLQQFQVCLPAWAESDISGMDSAPCPVYLPKALFSHLVSRPEHPATEVDLLLGIVCRIREYSWINPSSNSVAALHNNAVSVCLYEFFIE